MLKKLKSLFFKQDIVAKLVVNGVINQKTSQKLMQDIAKIHKQSKYNVKAVAVAVNSPGGSANQSEISGAKIKTLAVRLDVPLYTFAESLAASGGYWILCVGDKAYTNKNSLVGSIGVISMLPNFKGLFDQTRINRITISTSDQLIERRFDTLKEEGKEAENDREFLREEMKEIFEVFKEHVLKYRKDKIKEEDYDKVFNADVFMGDEALGHGLVDELGDLDSKMKELYPQAEIINFSKESPLEQLKKRFTGGRAQSSIELIIQKALQNMREAKSA